MTKATKTLWLRLAFFAAIVLFFVLYLRGIDYDNLKHLDLAWSLVIVASAFGMIFRYWGVMIWRFILKDLGAQELPAFRVLADIYAKAWMGRYIPGTFTWIAGKVYLASQMGISKSRLAVASLLEGGMQIIAISSVSLLILGFDSRLNVISSQVKIVMGIIGLALLIVLSPKVFNRLIRSAYKLIRRQEAHEELSTNGRTVVRAFILYAIGAFITGTSYFFFTRAIVPTIGWHEYFYIIGTFNLAGAIGMAALFVPSGLGVREGVQLVLLSSIMPKEMALIVTVASRLWSAAVDVLFYGIAASWRRFKPPTPGPPSASRPATSPRTPAVVA